MKKELPYFYIGASYGGNQDWFSTFMMRLGGCAAETAMELCIYLDKYFDTALYPFDKNNVTKKDYVSFSEIMKPYLHPRMSGIYKTSMYIDGFSEYLKMRKSGVSLSGFEGTENVEKAKAVLIRKLDENIPVPFLCLYHKNPRFKEYEWHWFIINGYERFEDTLMVKAVTYSTWEWLDFDELYSSNSTPKGGMILVNTG